MRRFDRRVPLGVLPVLVAVAILGYVAGHSRSQGVSTEKLRTASAANVVLDYPSTWRHASGDTGVPGLPIAHSIALAPDGNAAHAGLLVGALPRGELGPLPGRFIASMRALPETEVVNLQEVQAYRYANLSVPGFDRMLTLFVIPNPHGDPTALACFASASFRAYMRTCEKIVATLTLVGQSQSYDLTPEPNYARRISTSIATLNRLRLTVRRELRPQAAPATVQVLATRLARGFASAGASVSKLEPTFAAGQVQSVLSSSIMQARDAYIALAAAAAGESASEYIAARKRVYEAESNVNWALENFALLGYDPANRTSEGSSS
jgi:hypothetical protein